MVVSATRPRIWVTPASLAALKAKAVPTNDRWNTLLTVANSAVSWDIGINNYTLAYLITGNADFAAKAWNLMSQSMTSGVSQVSSDSFYQCRNFFPSAAIVYDWLYPWMNTAQKQQLQASIELCADAVWPETDPTRTSGWAIIDALDNYFQGFLTTSMAGLALFGDSVKAQGYLDNFTLKYNTLQLPALSGPAQGGVWPEGSNYGIVSTGLLLYSLLAHQSATGEDLITPNPWFTDMVTAMIHLTNPPMTEMTPFGDLGAGPINDNHRRAMLLMASRDTRCQPWLDSVTPNRCSQRLNAFLEFIWYPG